MSKQKKDKPKMTKDVVPQDFTLSLAAVDSVPVLFFGGSMIVLSMLFSSKLFLIGALLVFFAGAAKVLWKFIVVLKKKNVWWMFMQMRILTPAGFLLMLLAVLLNLDRLSLSAIWAGLTSFPSVLFFLLGFLGMVLMGVFAAKLDSSDLKSNWIEQCTNALAQASIFTGLILLLK